MSQQYLKLSKNSQSAAVPPNAPGDGGRDEGQQPYQDQGKAASQHLSKGKSEVQASFPSKKLNRRDLNLIPPSAAIVQSSQTDGPYSASQAPHANNHRAGYQLTLNSTQNKNKTSTQWDNIGGQQSRVTTVKHEKGLSNGTIMQCLKQFQRKQTRQTNHQPQQSQDPSAVDPNTGATKPGISLQSVTPAASQNVANMPISTKSNKSQKSTNTRHQTTNNASMAAEAHAQRRQNFTCTTTTKGSLRLTKKSPSNGREGQQNNMMVNQGRIQQQRERSSNAKHTSANQNYQAHKNVRGSTSQQHNAGDKMSRQPHKTSKKAADGANASTNPDKLLNNAMDFESKFAMLMRIREERSNESKPELVLGDSQKMMLLTQSNNPYDPVKLISPNTTTNRQSSQDTKLLTLKNFQPAKQISSNVVTPKYLKFKTGGEKLAENAAICEQNLKQQQAADDQNEVRNPKVQSRSQISTHKATKQQRDQQVYGTAGSSPDAKGPQSRVDRNTQQQNATTQSTQAAKSLSNNSRQKYQTAAQQPHQQQLQFPASVPKGMKPGAQKGHLPVKSKNAGAPAQQPTAPQMRYSVPPDSKTMGQGAVGHGIANKHSQAQQQVQSSNSALNGSSELQKRFTRGEIGSHHDASVSSGKANKSFQFGHNTALMSCSSGGDSSNPPQPVRRRSSSGKNGKQQIKISQIQNVNPVIIQPGTSTSAGIQNQNDNSYLNLQHQIPQSTTNNQRSGKHFTFAMNTRSNNQQKASRPNKHSNSGANAYNPSGATTVKANPKQHPSSQAVQQSSNIAPVQQSYTRDASGNPKSASKGKSVSAKKGKAQGVIAQQKGGSIASKKQNPPKGKTPEQMFYDKPQPAIVQPQTVIGTQVTQSIPIHHTSGLRSSAETGAGSESRPEKTQKLSAESTPNTSVVVHQQNASLKDGKTINRRPTNHQRQISGDQQQHFSIGESDPQRDSIADESSQDLVQMSKQEHIEQRVQESHYKRLAEEIQQKDNIIQQLYQALGRKDEQLNALTVNCEQLSNSLKSRDEKRDRSQQAIKETLKNLEEKLQMFTAQSQHNQGGLRQITQSPYEAKRLMQHQQQQPQIILSGGVDLSQNNKDPNQTPNLSKQRMEPIQLNFQHSQAQHSRPTSTTLFSVPLQPNQQRPQQLVGGASTQEAWNRRPSQISEIDSLVTVAEYMGTQYDGYKMDGGSNYELSAAKNQKEQPFLLGEGTIGSLASDIQLLTTQNRKQQEELIEDKANFPLFKKNEDGDVDDLGELTSLSEMEMSNVHDASLDQLERDLMETQHKLQEQSVKAAAFVKTQQNNFIDLKANMKPKDDKHVILEMTEEAEDDVAQMIPKRTTGSGSSAAFNSQTQKINLQKVKQDIDAMIPDMGNSQFDDIDEEPSSQEMTQQNNPSLQAPQVLDAYTYQSSSLANKSDSFHPKHSSNNNKLSKTLSKNKMKLKLAAEILGLKRDLVQQQAIDHSREEEKSFTDAQTDDKSGTQSTNNKLGVKKKIQLPLKISKVDSNRLVFSNRSQERGTLSNHSGSGQYNQAFNSVTIRNIKNSLKAVNTDEAQKSSQTKVLLQQQQQQQQSQQQQQPKSLTTKSPQSRQGVQIQGQGNMLSQRLTVKNMQPQQQVQAQQQQQQVQKIDKLTANQLLRVQKLQQGHRPDTDKQRMQQKKM